jgi:hypothetical protein
MEYQKLSKEEQIQGFQTRIRQLEEEHFNNYVTILEAEVLGDSAAFEDFSARNDSVEKRITALNKLVSAQQDAEEKNGITE